MEQLLDIDRQIIKKQAELLYLSAQAYALIQEMLLQVVTVEEPVETVQEQNPIGFAG